MIGTIPYPHMTNVTNKNITPNFQIEDTAENVINVEINPMLMLSLQFISNRVSYLKPKEHVWIVLPVNVKNRWNLYFWRV